MIFFIFKEYRAISELPPHMEVGASWSISPTGQVFPGSKGRTDLD